MDGIAVGFKRRLGFPPIISACKFLSKSSGKNAGYTLILGYLLAGVFASYAGFWIAVNHSLHRSISFSGKRWKVTPSDLLCL